MNITNKKSVLINLLILFSSLFFFSFYKTNATLIPKLDKRDNRTIMKQSLMNMGAKI